MVKRGLGDIAELVVSHNRDGRKYLLRKCYGPQNLTITTIN